MGENKEKISYSIIHKEGLNTIVLTGIILIALNFGIYYFNKSLFILNILFTAISAVVYFLIIYFFRVPKRIVDCKNNIILSPADGKIVVIENTFEKEYFNDYRTQISIFMSPLNVHVNWAPVKGQIQYNKYHPGSYLVAWNPKASEENERFTTVFKTVDNTEILIRQIAGKLARRIVNYSKPSENYEQGEQVGIIKFGSRVDVFLPPTAKVKVNINQKVKGKISVIAEL